MQYPKMLYKGDKESYSSRIVHDEEEEAKCREIGLTDYADLPEPEPKIEEVTPSVSEKITWLEDQLATSQGEFITFQNDIAAMKARIAELQGDTTPVGSTSYSGAHLISLNDLTLAQLQEMAKSKGVEFKARDSKATLIKLLSE